MNKRDSFFMTICSFLWDFAIDVSAKNALKRLDLKSYQADSTCKWERRFFWQDGEKVILKNIGRSFLNFQKYIFVVNDDAYFIHMHHDKNIKFRNDKVTYKPLLSQDHGTAQYGPKEKYDLHTINPLITAVLPELEKFKHHEYVKNFLAQSYEEIPVLKEAFIYCINETLGAQFELSRLKIGSHFYLSLCLEARSRELISHLDQLFGIEKPSLTYVQFLKMLHNT